MPPRVEKGRGSHNAKHRGLGSDIQTGFGQTCRRATAPASDVRLDLRSDVEGFVTFATPK